MISFKIFALTSQNLLVQKFTESCVCVTNSSGGLSKLLNDFSSQTFKKTLISFTVEKQCTG